METISRIIGKYIISRKVMESVLSGRGNMKEDFPSDFSVTEIKNIRFVSDFTMTSPERLVSLSRALDYIVENKIAGNIVECGVWKGGSMMMVAQKLLEANDLERELYLFDTFEGMPAPDDRDISALDQRKAEDLLNEADQNKSNNVWCYSSLDEVKANLEKTNYPAKKIFFIKGKVENTLPLPSIGKIALLRLDTDWYESTRHELEILYDNLVSGGILIIDDYGHWSGSRKAVDEFIEKRKLQIFLSRIDYTGRIAVKM